MPDEAPFHPPAKQLPAASQGIAHPADSTEHDNRPEWLDSMPGLFSHFDIDCRLLHCNAAYADWMGQGAADLVGKTLDALVRPEDMPVVMPHVRKALAGTPVTYIREQTQGRVTRWLETRLQPAWSPQQAGLAPQVVGFYCLELDRSADKLQLDRTALLRHASGATFWTLDLQQGLLHSEQNWADPALREQAATFTMPELLALLPEADRPAVLQGLQQVMQAGQVSPSVEARIRRKDGSLIWTRNQGLVSRWTPDGQPLELMGISVDITATKQALDDLQRSEQRFRTFAELSSDWFWELDAQGRFTSMSASSLRNRNVQQVREAVLGRAWQDINPAMAALPQWVALHTLMQRQLPFHDLVLPYRGDDMQTRWWSLSGTPIWNAQNQLTGWRGVARDITEQRQAEDKLYVTAYTDTLTGLSNRAGFERLLQSTLDHSQDAGGALLFIDLDQFKQINDSLGHSVGDRLLAEAAHRIQDTLRAGDLTGRFGGDEFLVYSRRSDTPAPDEALVLAERLRADLARPYTVEGRMLHTTVSVGVAQFPRDGSGIAELLSHADAALHEAKTLGRNRAQVFTPELLARVRRRAQLEAELHAALEADAFAIALQPIARLQLRAADADTAITAQQRYAIVGFEALARWTRPDGEEVSPLEFVPIILDLGLIFDFGLQILRKSLRALRDLRETCGYTGHLSVNLSPAQLKGGCVTCLRDELSAAGIEPGLLTVELTENLQIMVSEDCLLTLNGIRDLGVKISLDDFGVGFSNLEYLTSLPATQIKIDRAFTHGVATDRYKAAVVTATLAMAASLGLETVAEGVENLRDLQWIEQAGCTQVQGWALWRAMDVDAACALLRHTLRR